MERLRRLRTEKGLSQARLAARAELDPSTVNQIERGAREASPATLRKLAGALDVGIVDLLEDTSPKAQRRSSPEPSLFNGLEGERHLGYLRAYRDELMATAAHARAALLEGVDSFSEVDGWDATPETALSYWNGEINSLHEDALWRAEVWADLEDVSGRDLPREERELVDDVRRWLRSYEETARALRSRLEEEWARLRERDPGAAERLPDALAPRLRAA